MQKRNHPKKGSIIKVEPIRKQLDINLIKSRLLDNPRNFALFTLGINTNLRAADIANLTVAQVKDVKPGGSLEIRERKTGKIRRITLNNGVYTAIQHLLDTANLNLSDPLFKSQRGGRLAVPSINRLVKGWCDDIRLPGNYGSHTLRKTWGFHAYKAGIDLPRLMICFNHSSQRQTLDYLCIQDPQIREVYLKVEL